ncbi:alpha-amylase family glycosyl hydrolase [Mangrovibacillus cuniculi]|uniref:Alpha-amylase n=1 Tax=Mangrovibacillus cuniculi TaxID=2593652 RepID=A0A7S8C9V9_9BACI|nr:alpha-amylase family glycosyl hydrolase [Mangrovibacillus cuniculi]QPC46047.1 alpha-amylase [Mangrovibacillus cuniculi]
MQKRVLTLLLIPFLLFYAPSVSALEEEERTWQDERIYFLMVDRFANGDQSNDIAVNRDDPRAYHGGDFRGIINSLDYIKEMGFTAIWLTPVFNNEPGGYHGYWIEDFYGVEEHFGTEEELKELVNEAHKRDMKVLLDFVVNHVGPNHPWANDPAKTSWFHEQKGITNDKNQTDVENGWIYDLPDLAQENPEVEKYLLNNAKWWINEFDVDGYRLDTVKHVPKSFWQKFSKAVKEEKEDFYLIGEVWSEDPRYIAEYMDTGIDGFVDFPLNQELRKVFSEPDQSMERLFTMWNYSKSFYQDPYKMGVFIDNHDMKRMTWEMTAKQQFPGTRWKQALTYMYTIPGIPIIYYGSEIALNGADDPDNRRMMQFNIDEDLIDYISTLSQLRDTHEPLRRGDMGLITEEMGVAVYKRFTEDETMLIAINDTSETKTVAISADAVGGNLSWKGLLATDTVKEQNGEYKITLERETSQIYEPFEDRGINYWYAIVLVGVYVLFMVFLYIVKKKGKKQAS